MALLRHPLGLLAAFAGLVLALLALPLRLPIGSNYWDLYTYVDTAHRMQFGQLPHVDFFVPVGSLGYVLYDLVAKVFPGAQTLLAVHYAILIVALPIMVFVAIEARRRSNAEALALVVPFLLFALLPINGIELYSYPGFDGFGNYNRHVALLLYVLSATLLFVDNRNSATAIVAVLLAALFMTKITGFVVGALLVVHAALAGRLALRAGLLSGLALAAVFALIQWRTGLISAYVADIIELVQMNTGALLPRFLTVFSQCFHVIALAGILVLVLTWRDRPSLHSDLRAAWNGRSLIPLQQTLDADWVWLLSLLLAGMIFETQNTGSHEFILIWPALLRLFRSLPLPWQPGHVVVLGLIAATALPTPITVVHRAARAIASAPSYEPLDLPALGPFARVSVKPDIMRQSRAMLAHYPMARASFEQVANRGVLPSFILFSEIDFQVSWLVSTAEAAAAIRSYESDNRKVFPRIVTLDFVDPLPVALGRQPLRDMSIGNDPTRTLAKLGPRALAEIASADAILLPKCPVTEARNAIANAYAPSLAGRRLVALTPCFDMLVKD